MKIMKSAEDYLETMLMLQERHGYIRSIDIAAELGVTKPSVSYATKRLREAGYISMAEDGHITLLPPGLEIAEDWLSRHGFTEQQNEPEVSDTWNYSPLTRC